MTIELDTEDIRAAIVAHVRAKYGLECCTEDVVVSGNGWGENATATVNKADIPFER